MKFIMNFLRSPFQFRSSDQPNRKAESGSPTVENMFIDPTTGLTTDPRWKSASPGIGASSSISGSPRLQHRVPGFENNGNHPVEVIHEPSTPQSVSGDEGEKSHRVRVVPIQVENVDDYGTPKKRSSAFHSSSGSIPRSNKFGPMHNSFEDLHNKKRHSSGPALHKKSDATECKPKVCNIPIFVEGRDTPVVPQTSQSSHNVPVHNTVPPPKTQFSTAKQNGGNLGKCSTKSKCKQDTKQTACDVSQKQISDILSELQSLKTAVCEFKGVPQDKQYRYLDEMLTRCMLKLDNVDTYGDDEVRGSRKAAVKAVQECINYLESHAQTNTKLDQSGGTGEKCNSSDFTDTKNKETDVPKEQADLSVCENIQDTAEAVKQIEDLGNSSIVHEQSTAKETELTEQKTVCLEGTTDPTSCKLRESVKPVELITGLSECAEVILVQDEDKNCIEVEDIASNPLDTEEMETATNKIEESGKVAQVQDQPLGEIEEFKTSEASAGIVNKAIDSVELAVAHSHSFINSGDLPTQGEPMDSDEVPETKMTSDSEMVEVKNELVDSEMVELANEPNSVKENKETSVSTEISN